MYNLIINTLAIRLFMKLKNLKELPRDLFYIALISDLLLAFVALRAYSTIRLKILQTIHYIQHILRILRWKTIPHIKLTVTRVNAKVKYYIKSRLKKMIYIITKATGIYNLAKKIQNKFFR